MYEGIHVQGHACTSSTSSYEGVLVRARPGTGQSSYDDALGPRTTTFSCAGAPSYNTSASSYECVFVRHWGCTAEASSYGCVLIRTRPRTRTSIYEDVLVQVVHPRTRASSHRPVLVRGRVWPSYDDLLLVRERLRTSASSYRCILVQNWGRTDRGRKIRAELAEHH